MENDDKISFGVTSHYNQYTGFEVIDVCEQLRAPDGSGNFNRGNAFKYLARAGWKSPEKHVEDLEKAKNYIQREIDRLSKCDHPPMTVCDRCQRSSEHWLDGDGMDKIMCVPGSCPGKSCLLDHPRSR